MFFYSTFASFVLFVVNYLLLNLFRISIKLFRIKYLTLIEQCHQLILQLPNPRLSIYQSDQILLHYE